MGLTPPRTTQVLLVMGLVAVVQGGVRLNSPCNITAFEDRENSTLLMCSVLNPDAKYHTNFAWYFTNCTSSVHNMSDMDVVPCTQTPIASFINLPDTSTRTGQFVCIVSGPDVVTTNCSLQVTTQCKHDPPTACCATQLGGPLYDMREFKQGDSGVEHISSLPYSPYWFNFMPVGEDIKRVKMFECPVEPANIKDLSNSPAPPPQSASPPQSAPPPQSATPPPPAPSPQSVDNRTTTTTQPTPRPQTKAAAITTAQPPCNYQDKSQKGYTDTEFQVEFENFLAGCQGVYIFTNASGVITAVLYRMKEEVKQHPSTPPDEDGDDDNGDDDVHKWIGVIVVVVLVVVAAVAAAVVFFVRRRRLLQNSRRPIRHKMVSTISGSKVEMFNNMAYSKEEKSDLEEFPRKHIRFLDTIGKGTFGTVVMAEALNLLQKKKGPMSRNWATVAVKMTLISDKSNEELKSDFLCELALMKTIPPHVNIITLYASCTAHDPYLMLLEYARHGDLRKHLLEHRMERNYANAAFSAYGVSRKKERHYASAACAMYGSCNKKDKFEGNIYAIPGETQYSDFPSDDNDLITSRDLLSFALQICRGLEHLIRNKIVHRDVAARNVLLFDHNIVKISDFGLARKVGQGDVYERTRKGLLPIRWMSPESLFYNQFTEKSDVWSYGVLLWELITLGSTPYPGQDANTVLEKIRAKELLACPPHSATIVNNIVTSCWRDDPNARPTFVQLCQELEQLLEAEVEYVDLDQMNDHEYSTLDGLDD